jgi:hypothetical protein
VGHDVVRGDIVRDDNVPDDIMGYDIGTSHRGSEKVTTI